eukprot:TRINITY_DN3045_c0_g1_i1.p1 TRINITY_DN3045_c0_g1~~TRINITY_DN3045_c0_g1_i1.p1  ORF type:complete len:774 (+),score=55.45 TRINITY_DN3045_c0_g1_i1:89-2410(+)
MEPVTTTVTAIPTLTSGSGLGSIGNADLWQSLAFSTSIGALSARSPGGSVGGNRDAAGSGRNGADLPDLSIDVASINTTLERTDRAQDSARSGYNAMQAPAYYTLSPRSAASGCRSTSVPDTPTGPSPLVPMRPASVWPPSATAASATSALMSPKSRGPATAREVKGPQLGLTIPIPTYSPSSLEASYAGLDESSSISRMTQSLVNAAGSNRSAEIPIPTPPMPPHNANPRVSNGVDNSPVEGTFSAAAAAGSLTRKTAFKLRVKIVSARGLRDADPVGFGKSDPYCVCEISGKPNSRSRTQVVDNCLDPVWNHVCELGDVAAGDTLEFAVYDKDQWPKRDDLLGKARMPSCLFYPGGFRGEIELVDPWAPPSPKKKEPSALSVEIDVVGALANYAFSDASQPKVDTQTSAYLGAGSTKDFKADVYKSGSAGAGDAPLADCAQRNANTFVDDVAKPGAVDDKLTSAVPNVPYTAPSTSKCTSSLYANGAVGVAQGAPSRTAEQEQLEQRLLAAEEEGRTLRERVRELLRDRERSLDLESKFAALEDERDTLRAKVIRLEKQLKTSETRAAAGFALHGGSANAVVSTTSPSLSRRSTPDHSPRPAVCTRGTDAATSRLIPGVRSTARTEATLSRDWSLPSYGDAPPIRSFGSTGLGSVSARSLTRIAGRSVSPRPSIGEPSFTSSPAKTEAAGVASPCRQELGRFAGHSLSARYDPKHKTANSPNSPPPPSRYSMLRICENLPRNLSSNGYPRSARGGGSGYFDTPLGMSPGRV